MKWKRKATRWERTKRWHRKRLWFPTLIDDYWCWLETVWARRHVVFYAYDEDIIWEYSLEKPDE